MSAVSHPVHFDERPRVRKIVIMAELIAILVATLFMFPRVTETVATLHAVDWQMLTHCTEVSAFRESGLPRSGEFVLPKEVQVMVGMLRAVQVNSFRFSTEIANRGPTMQRLVEGAYPIRASGTAPYLVLLEGEQLPVGCSQLVVQEGVGLAYCR